MVLKHHILAFFLYLLIVTYDNKPEVENLEVDVVTSGESNGSDELKLSPKDTDSSVCPTTEKEDDINKLITNDGAVAMKRKASDDCSIDLSIKRDASDICKLKALQKKYQSSKHDISVMYLRSDWRLELCTCLDCKVRRINIIYCLGFGIEFQL